MGTGCRIQQPDGSQALSERRQIDLLRRLLAVAAATGMVCSAKLWVSSYRRSESRSIRETRIFVSAGRQVASWLGAGAAVRVIELGRPNPFTGQRKVVRIDPLTY